MAKGYSFVDLPTPGTPTAIPTAGGSLTAGVTYYYRVIGIAATGSQLSYVWNGKSKASVEFQGTADATNKSMTISFTSPVGACGAYRIWRSTTSNGYLAGSGCLTFYPTDAIYNSGGTVTFVDTGYPTTGSNVYLELENDPHGRLTLSGSTSTDKFSIIDLYNADVSNGWGVIQKLDTNTYKINCYLIEHTNMYWYDQEKTIIYADGLQGASGSNYQFGNITAGTNRTFGGCNIIFTCAWLSGISVNTMNAYRTTFQYVFPKINGTDIQTGLGLATMSFSNGTLQDCQMDRFRNCVAGSSTTCFITNFTMSRFDSGLVNARVTLSNIRMLSGSRAFQTSGSTTIYSKGAYTENTMAVLWIGTNNTVNLVDSQFSTPGTVNSDATGSVLNDKISFNLNVVDDIGTAISGATVQVYDKDGALVVNTTTASTGSITEQEVTRRQYTVTNLTVSPANNRYPFKIVVSKTGYTPYSEYVTYLTSYAVVKTVALQPDTFGNTTIYDSTLIDTTLY